MKFTVNVKEVHNVEVDVEADNWDAAISKVNQIIEEGNGIEDCHDEYSHTLESDEWNGFDENGNYYNGD